MQKENTMNDLREKLNDNKLKAKPPKLCKVCQRASYLKCMECETIYCSSKCQVDDWEVHQFTHSAMKQTNPFRQSMQARPVNVKQPSVHGRLALAVTKPPILAQTKDDIDAQLKRLDEKLAKQPTNQKSKLTNSSTVSPMEIDEISSSFKSVLVSETPVIAPAYIPHPLSVEAPLTDQNNRKMMSIRKFKRHVQIDDKLKDDEGYAFVLVTEVEEKPDGSVIFWIMPYDVKKSADAYKETINKRYEDETIETISSPDAIQKFKLHLVITKIEGKWCRANILNFSTPNVVSLEDIDSGKKTINVMPKDLIKVPDEADLLISAYAFKVMFENVESKDIECGNIVKLRITHADPYGISFAEVKAETESEMKEVTTAPIEAANVERLFIDKIQIKEFNVGPKVKLTFLDGSRLEKGKLHVCEGVTENVKFYNKLTKDIADYVKKNPNAGKYRPGDRELILSKFNDGCYYRAVCMQSSDLDAKVYYLDYGNYFITDVENIMKLPDHLLDPCCSHSVDVQLASKRPIEDIDADETRGLLLDMNDFEAELQLLPGSVKYYIVLDDSLVAFK